MNGQKPLLKGTQALSLLSIMDVPPLIAVPFFPTENSLGRRGASSARLQLSACLSLSQDGPFEQQVGCTHPQPFQGVGLHLPGEAHGQA